MLPAKYDLYVNQGDDFSEEFYLTDTDGAAVNLAGATVQGQVRTSYDAGSVVATFTGTVETADSGHIKIALPDTTTAGMSVNASAGTVDKEFTEYIYDVEIVYSSGAVEKWLEGTLFLNPETTKI